MQLTSYITPAHELLTCSSRASYLQLTSFLPAAHELLTCSSRATHRQLANCTRAVRQSSQTRHFNPVATTGFNLRQPQDSSNRHQTAPKHNSALQTARELSAHPQTASEAARAQFASTLEPLRLRGVRPAVLKIDGPSKYRILPYVSKQGL